MDGVAVKVAPVPAAPSPPGRRLSPGFGFGAWREGRRLRLVRAVVDVEAELHPVGHSFGVLEWAGQDQVPAAGWEGPGEIARSRLLRRDEEAAAGATAPAPEATLGDETKGGTNETDEDGCPILSHTLDRLQVAAGMKLAIERPSDLEADELCIGLQISQAALFPGHFGGEGGVVDVGH